MLTLVLLLIYVFSILTVIFLERKSPYEAVLWVVVLIFLPYLGLFLYLIFGSTFAIKITSYMRKKRLQQCYPDVSLPAVNELKDIKLVDEDRQVIEFNETYNHSELTSYDDIEVFTTGESHYRSLFEDLKNAKECIYIEFYTIHHDLMGEALVKTLTEKAKEGVKVLVLCDFIANIPTPNKMFEPLRAVGGKVVRVKPFLTHYRSHRKNVVIDHEIAYIGGMNIGKQYANMHKKKNPWRDTQVRLTGACTAILDEYFLIDYLCSIRKKDWDTTVKYVNSLKPKHNFLNNNLCQFIVGGVDTSKESVKMCYLSMIRSAKKCIRIQSPYFIPDVSILDALKTAAASGIQIELMIPGIKASFFLDPVTTYYAGQLLEYGAKVTKYQGYIHAKTMIIDDELCCIGSVNMDMRSLQVDDEICGVFYQNDFVAEYSHIYDEDLKHCDEYTYGDFESRSNKEKCLESFFLLFAPLM